MLVRLDKRVNIYDALVFDYNHVGVQIEGLKLVKDDDFSLIRLAFFEKSYVGSLKIFLAHVYHGTVALQEVDLEIQGVFCSNRHLFLELISIPILENGVIFGYYKILREDDVILLLED